ncbi:MAG: phosphoglucosamine mutase, partial [Bacteroidota bacterium]
LLLLGAFRTFSDHSVRPPMSLMAGISGVRGIVGSTLTPEVVVRYVSAFAEYCNRGHIMIGRDGRITGKPITHLVSSTLVSMGCDVIGLGICPTPTIQLAVEQTGAAGGIAVTASHNPIVWNGLKFLASSGMFLDAQQNAILHTIVQRPNRQYVPWDQTGGFTADATWIDKHIDAILRISYLNLRTLRQRKFKVVVDCVNAAGSVMVPRLLKTLGCKVIEMNCDSSGIFAHDPEPVPQNLASLSRRVKREKADLGIAVDPDVDRLVLIDEKGRPIGEEYTIATVVKFVLTKEIERTGRKRKKSALNVVINLSTTRAVEDIAAQYNATVIRTPVGEINVAKTMKETGAIVGGEGSGGVILPKVHLGRDALVGIALTLQHLADFGGPLSELRKSLPDYAIEKAKIEAGPRNPREIMNRLADRYAGKGTVNTDDGLRVDFGDSWVHLRPSNTEPIIRIICEAPKADRAKELMNAVMRDALE